MHLALHSVWDRYPTHWGRHYHWTVRALGRDAANGLFLTPLWWHCIGSVEYRRSFCLSHTGQHSAWFGPQTISSVSELTDFGITRHQSLHSIFVAVGSSAPNLKGCSVCDGSGFRLSLAASCGVDRPLSLRGTHPRFRGLCANKETGHQNESPTSSHGPLWWVSRPQRAASNGVVRSS